MFEDLIAKIVNLSEMTQLTTAEIAREEKENPGVPQVYLDFMRVVGWGDLGGLMIYSGLIYAHEMFGDSIPSSTGVALFGDNFCGSYFGFDFEDNAQLVEITMEDAEVESVDVEFEELILRLLN